jgi:multidrug efflux pump subunit AcrA (membrane-fusion protein)
MKILQYTVERHKRHVGRHKHDLDRYSINSPMDGLIVMQPYFRAGEMKQYEAGDQVSPGTLFMRVVDLNTMQVEARINQTESGELKIGQEATIGFDAFPDMKFKGRIYSIGALATRGWRENYYVRNIPVRIQIEGADPRLIPDLSAYADVKIEAQEDAVVVPRNALIVENGKTYVEVRNGDRWERREVEAGVANAVETAVTEGLKPGDELRLY